MCYSHCYAMDYSDSNMGVRRNIGVLVIVGTVWVLVIDHLKSWYRAKLRDLVLKKWIGLFAPIVTRRSPSVL